ncbi:tetratricopeptide repeat protein [Blastopirellula marina]|uniref:Uncharacterized protein n=1 Tax=Blastopirellula marina TaxID=124 RepID=A0A2S8GSM9_9BACT|nr:tetratricopeptide repeat protein [Blastopirellula marina]PQO47432.1 hypothetical protein C5Y93_05150 [Blastopirellula marina]
MPPSHVNSPPLYRLHAVWIGLILGLGTLFFANSFRGEFVFDDEMMLTGARDLSKAPLKAWLRPSPRAVGSASFALNYLAGGTHTFGYHLANLAIHLSAALVLYWLVWRTLQSPRLVERYGQAAVPLAGVIALIWTLHPLQTQSVTYIVQRYESLMGLFFLLTIACLVRGVDTGKRLWLVASLGFCLLGMQTKEVMAAAPIMALWYDRVFLAESWRELWRKRWAYYAAYLLALASLILFIAMHWSWIGKRGTLFHDHLSPLAYAMNQGAVILHYVRLTFWPQGQNIDYGWPPSDNYVTLIAADLVIVALLCLTVWAIWKAPALGFLGGWFFVILAPSSSFAPIIDLAFEHRMYLPLLSLAAMTVIGAYEALTRYVTPVRRPAVAGVVAALVIVSLGITTTLRNEVYDTPLSLWSDVMRKSPEHWRSYVNLGKHYAEAQQPAKAAPYFAKAYELNPDDHRVLNNYASLQETHFQNYELAEECYLQAIADNPDYPVARFNYGSFLNDRGRHAEAQEQLQLAYAKSGEFPQIRLTLGAIELHLGNRAEAQRLLEEELAIRPHEPLAHNLLGLCLTERDDKRAAIHFLTAIQLNPKYVEAHNNVADLFVRLGRYDLAEQHLQAALAVEPQNQTVRRNLAVVRQALATPN